MRRWRCSQCNHEFKTERNEAAAVCPGCRLDTAAHPRFKNVLVECKTIHFDPPTQVQGIGLNRPACKPAAKICSGFGNDLGSGDPTSVNCEACRETPEWHLAYHGEPVIPEEHDERLTPKTAEELAKDEEEARKAEATLPQ